MLLFVFELDRRPGDAALLSADETARAARLRFARDRDRFIAGRARLRHILASLAGTRAEALRFSYNAFGKPALAEGPAFSMSHSGSLGALAVADFPLGIDIEAIRPIELDVARRFFAPDEVAALEALPEPARLRAFYACWTRKEAYIKARGTGVSLQLDGFSVSVAGTARLLAAAPNDDARSWSMQDLTPADGVAGAIAARQPVLRLEWANVPHEPR